VGQIPTALEISLGGETLNLTPQGTVAVHAANLSTNLPGVFAGGDNVTGSASVVQAVGAGKQAARSIQRFLQGEPLEEKARIPVPRRRLEPLIMPEEERAQIPPLVPKMREVKDRIRDFGLVELDLADADYQRESYRCLRCDLGE
jgi:hypothetical protein